MSSHHHVRAALVAPIALATFVGAVPASAGTATGHGNTGTRCATPATGPVRTFDGEPTGAPPAVTTTRGTVVVAATPYGPSGNQGVHLTDTSTTSDSAVLFPASAAPARRFTMDLAPHVAVPFVVAVHGVDALGTDVVLDRLTIGPVYSFGRSAAAQVSVADGASTAPWTVIPQLTDQDAPTRVVLAASTNALVLQVGDFVFRTTMRAATAAAVTGVEVASAGIADTGTDLYVDNVSATDQVRARGLRPGPAAVGRIDRLTATTDAPVSDVARITDPGRHPSDLRAEVYVGDRWVPAAIADRHGRLVVRAALDEPDIGLHPVSVTLTGRRGSCRSVQLDTQSFAPVPTHVVAQESGPEQPRFPDATRLHDGRILVVYHYANAHTNASGVIRLVSSADDGRTWSRPVTVVSNQYDNRDPKIAQLRDGTVLLTTFQTNWAAGGANVGTFVYRSTDGGRTFPTVTRVDSTAGTYEHAPALQLPNGDVLQPLYGGGARIARSTDDGRTFPADQQQLVVADDASYTNVEPNVVRLPTGELVMIIRTTYKAVGADRQSRIVRSFDDGRTWTAPEATDIPASSDHLLLTRSGSVLITFGNMLQPLRPTYAALITDPAGAWTGHRQVPVYNSGAGDDQANPSSVQLADGSFLSFGYDIATRQVVSWRTRARLYR